MTEYLTNNYCFFFERRLYSLIILLLCKCQKKYFHYMEKRNKNKWERTVFCSYLTPSVFNKPSLMNQSFFVKVND